MKVKILAKKLKEDVIKWRREFHMYPEESLKEYETSKKILNELRNFGIQCEIIADTGVVATIHGYAPGKTVALRGDIDALAVIEKTNKEYSSKIHGLMHACGHDCHGAMLLVAAKLLFQLKNEFKGTIKLIFQPGEEIAKGAKKMIENGVLKDVDAILGIHVSSDLLTGTISCEAGPRLASADIFKINICGEGGHGSRPDQCIDSVVVASAIVMNLQSVVSREFSPLEPTVLTVGSINSGTRFNVIAPNAILEGTTRCYNNDIRQNFPTIINRIAKSTAEAYRATAQLEYIFGVGPTINDNNLSSVTKTTAIKLFGKNCIVNKPPSTGGEDFSEFSNIIPGVMVNLGVKNKYKNTNYPHHHELFDVDEDALETGVALYSQFALDFLNI